MATETKLGEGWSARIGEACRRAGGPARRWPGGRHVDLLGRDDGGRLGCPAIRVDGGELGQGTLGIVKTEPAVLMRVTRLAAFESEGEAQEGDEENDGRAMSLLHGRAFV